MENMRSFDNSTAWFREAFKMAGIKGVSVRAERGGYSYSYCFTIKLTAADLVPVEDYKPSVRGNFWFNYIDDYGHVMTINSEDFLTTDRFSKTEREAILKSYAELQYTYYADDVQINQYWFADSVKHGDIPYTAVALAKIQQVLDIIKGVHSDNSDRMTDYFDVNFYYNVNVKIRV